MNNFTKLTLVSALMLGTAFGVARAQQATDEPAPTPGAEQTDGGPDGGFDDGEGWGRHGRHGRHEGMHGGRHGPRGGPVLLIDANADGVINDDEAASLADLAFARMDQNGDAALSEAEYTSPRGGKGHGGGWFNWGNSDEAAAVLKVRKDKFAALDTDKNAAVSKVEFFADAKAKLAAADADKDGKVSPWEFRAQN
jgi:EF hand